MLNIFEYVLYVLATAYATWFFLIDHVGPFPFKNKQVSIIQDDNTVLIREVNIVDYFRRLFGVFSIVRVADGTTTKEYWTVKPIVHLWFCPYCLSFWVYLPVAVHLLLTKGYAIEYIIIVTLSTNILVGFIVSLMRIFNATLKWLDK